MFGGGVFLRHLIFKNNNPGAETSKMNQVRPTLVKKGATLGQHAQVFMAVLSVNILL